MLHHKNFSSNKLALIILFAINQQCRFATNIFINRFEQPDVAIPHVEFPLILVQPTVKFERMKAQEGSFIYQVPLFLRETNQAKEYITFSKIPSDVTFIITDKKKMLRSLNMVGINQKSIFSDHDSIANFLKYKLLMD